MTLLRPRQKLFVERSLAALKENGNTLGVGPTGCHAEGTPILCYDGSVKPVEAIQVGDELMGPDSQPRRVLQLCSGEDDLFEIKPTYGDSFIVNAGHILSLAHGKERVNLSVATYLQKRPAFKRYYQLYRTAIDFPSRPITTINPYERGLLITDPHLVLGPATITNEYKLASRLDRQALFAGLIDCSGHVSGRSIVFHNDSLTLVEDIAFLARSLGFFAAITSHDIENGNSVRIEGDFSQIPIQQSHKRPASSLYQRNPLYTGFTVRLIGRGDYYGFSLNGDHLYVMGDFTVTHNSGKTIMLSAVTGQWLTDKHTKACVLAHRDELTSQNEAKFLRVNPNLKTSVFDAQKKSWDGQVTFSMVQTLSREKGLHGIPALDLLVIDEAHHAAADSYRRVIDTARERNPEIAIYGVTATPNRSDKKGLRDVFSNVADQITFAELIASGHLVPPKTFDIDLGQRQALAQLKGSVNEVDTATSQLLNTRPTNEAVVKHWQDKAGDRQTIVFCSTVDHAIQVAEAFHAFNVATECIHGRMTSIARQAALARYESGESQVIVNVGVLTEGYDYQPTSCIVLLRLESHRSVFLQMIGRGLRVVDPREYPGVTKTDCIVLDFGTSTSNFGRLEESVNLDGSLHKGEAPTKTCPECDAILPAATQTCSLCGYLFDTNTDTSTITELNDFVMNETDLLSRSLFQWCDIFNDQYTLLATGFDAWAGLFFLKDNWYAVGGLKKTPPTLLAVGEKLLCLAAADDWLNEHETEQAAVKSKRWLHQPATQQQLHFLNQRYRHDFDLTRYHASCLLAFKFNKRAIKGTIFKAAASQQRAA